MSEFLVGVTGAKRHGKDTFAGFLSELVPGCRVLHFADKLKDQASEVFGLPRSCFEGGQKEMLLPEPLSLDLWLPEMRGITGLPLEQQGCVASSSREVLQLFGTEYVRAVDPGYWVDTTMAMAREGPAVIADVRFLGEGEAVREAGGRVVWVELRGAIPSGDRHVSEQLPVGCVGQHLRVAPGHLDCLRRAAAAVARGGVFSGCCAD